ncbi:hypothetical protein EC968_007841 [Mortierella alpina]|nr:hypothetical protein EC968_007841 [Mortierella alpina]
MHVHSHVGQTPPISRVSQKLHQKKHLNGRNLRGIYLGFDGREFSSSFPCGDLRLWVMRYRNGGFKRTIVTDLYSMEGSGIRPKPVFNSCRWMAFVLTPVFYLVGTSYVIPVTEFDGKFAIYRTPATHGQLHSEIRVFYPNHRQRNVFLVFGIVFPGLCCASFGIASGVLVDQGYTELAEILELVEYTNWTLVYWLVGSIILYYGVKFTLILRAHIITTEARRGLPFAAFGIDNLKSRSPARYLFIVLQITTFAAGSVLLWSGSLNAYQTWDKKSILKSKDVRCYHFLVFMGSIPATLAYFVKLILITVHCYRSKDQGLAKAPGQTVISQKNDGGQSMELLALHLHPNISSFSEATRALERGLYEFATMHYPEDIYQQESKSDGREHLQSKVEIANNWSVTPAINLGPAIEKPTFALASVDIAKGELASTTLMEHAFSKAFLPSHSSSLSPSWIR